MERDHAIRVMGHSINSYSRFLFLHCLEDELCILLWTFHLKLTWWGRFFNLHAIFHIRSFNPSWIFSFRRAFQLHFVKWAVHWIALFGPANRLALMSRGLNYRLPSWACQQNLNQKGGLTRSLSLGCLLVKPPFWLRFFFSLFRWPLGWVALYKVWHSLTSLEQNVLLRAF